MKNTADGRSTRWDTHRLKRRLTLIESVIDAIEIDGPEISIEQISERVGMARPLLYRHFADRSALQDAVVSHAASLLLGAFAPIWANHANIGSLVTPTVQGYFAWVLRHPNVSRYCLHHSSPLSAHSLRTIIAQRLSEIFQAYFGTHGMTQTSADILAISLVGMAEAAAHWWLAHPESIRVEALAVQTGHAVFAVLQAHLVQIGIVISDDGVL